MIECEISVSDDRMWYLNDQEMRAVKGCIDIDLNFSPVTNLLPLKRLELGVGESQDVRAAWLRFPSFSLEPLEQRYSRIDNSIYNYQSKTGFEKDITVDNFGLVTEYPDFWIQER